MWGSKLQEKVVMLAQHQRVLSTQGCRVSSRPLLGLEGGISEWDVTSAAYSKSAWGLWRDKKNCALEFNTF